MTLEHFTVMRIFATRLSQCKAHIFLALLILPAALSLNACDVWDSRQAGAPALQQEKLQQEIQVQLRQDTSAAWLKQLPVRFYDTLKVLYAQREYSPFWVESLPELSQAKTLLRHLALSEEHGIPNKRYASQLLDSLCESALRGASAEKQIHYQDIAKLDIGLSLAFLLYETDLTQGITDTAFLDEGVRNMRTSFNGVDVFANLNSNSRVATLEKVQPKRPQYTGLQTALRELRKLQSDSAKTQSIPLPDMKIKKGQTSALLPLVASKLKFLGFLDTNYQTQLGMVYDSVLFGAVKEFQSRHGLLDDGVIGKITVEQLNMPLRKKIEKVRVNLERLRWNTYPDSGSFIFINLPEFKLHAFREGSEEAEIVICAGQRREKNFEERQKIFEKTKRWSDKPKNFETPQLRSNVYMIITNPTWNVPTSIARNETLAEIQKDSNYLKKHSYKVFKGGKRVDPSAVDWKSISRAGLQYDFVQDPGAGNALGKIKFIFRNDYSVYLHDTPTRAPFANANRAVSHGCMRLEKPMLLAEFLLKENTTFDLDDIKCELGMKPAAEEKMEKYKKLRDSGTKTRTRDLSLDKPMPIYIDYFTSWIDKNGKLRFAPDVYDKDQLILRAIQQ